MFLILLAYHIIRVRNVMTFCQHVTLKFRHSFFPDTSNIWNYLSSFIKNAPTLNAFKKHYMDFVNITPGTFPSFTHQQYILNIFGGGGGGGGKMGKYLTPYLLCGIHNPVGLKHTKMYTYMCWSTSCTQGPASF